MNQKPNWKFRSLDLDFPWGFSKQGAKDDFNKVVKKLKNFEHLTWAEIDKNKKWNHSILISKMSQPARKRLEELKIDAGDQETLYQLRIAQKERIYGIREHGEFHIIWWDPEHKANPSKKPNT